MPCFSTHPPPHHCVPPDCGQLPSPCSSSSSPRQRRMFSLTYAELHDIGVVRPRHDEGDEEHRDPVQNSPAVPLDVPRTRWRHVRACLLTKTWPKQTTTTKQKSQVRSGVSGHGWRSAALREQGRCCPMPHGQHSRARSRPDCGAAWWPRPFSPGCHDAH